MTFDREFDGEPELEDEFFMNGRGVTEALRGLPGVAVVDDPAEIDRIIASSPKDGIDPDGY